MPSLGNQYQKILAPDQGPDSCPRPVYTRIRDSVRSDAVVVRWGGEEFLVVDRIPAAQAAGVAERIRTAVSAPARPVVTASIGLATCTRPGSDLAEVITAADVAMYQAKARGGDRVAIAADLG